MFILQNCGAKVVFFLYVAKYFHVFLPVFYQYRLKIGNAPVDRVSSLHRRYVIIISEI